MARPLTVTVACLLLLVAAGLSAAGNLAQYAAIGELAGFSATRGVATDAAALGSMRTLLLWKGGLVVLFLAGLAALLFLGRSRAARLLLTVGIIGGLAASALLFRATIHGLDMLQAAAMLGAVVLLWLPASTAWLRHGKTGV